jgi:bifunctional DNase/RNase
MEPDDHLIVLRVLAGDKAAFGDLVDRHRPEAVRLARRLLRGPDAVPAEQRDTVELHYVDGLKLWEIASLVDAPVGTIKARLHRARARLRHALAEAVAVGRHPPAALQEALMVEVTVEDVVLRSPRPEPAVWLADPKENRCGWWRVVLLKERGGERVLPIWLNPLDGDFIAMRLVGLGSYRPMPHDLIERLLRIAELRLEKVAVTGLRDNTFYATLWVRAGDALHEVDARPSDAIALALDAGAPIFVTEETFGQTGVKVLGAGRELPALEAIHLEAVAAGRGEPEREEREWRSFRSLPRHEASWLRARPRPALPS